MRAHPHHPAPPATDGPAADTVVLGIDPGLQRTGYAVLATRGNYERSELVEAGVIRLKRDTTLAARLIDLEAGLSEIITAHAPNLVACEELYAHYRHPRTAILMAHARGVILALAARRDIPIAAVPATQAKKILTGSGRAGKAQMQRAVQATLGLAAIPEPHDVADAIAIGLCGMRLRLAGEIGRLHGEPPT